jgi:aryl-alcohol dehydrogenase-like predicted oxidoreductase
MEPQTADLERRRFLKSSVIAAGAAALGPAAALGAAAASSPPQERQDRPLALPVRPFGKTGVSLPILGMGTSSMVALFYRGYGVKLLSRDERVATVRHAFERGVRYFDTARVYGEAESIVGEALQGVRGDAFFATKVHTTDPAEVRRSVETSLKELRTDRIDLLQVHSPAIERAGFDGAMAIHAQLLKLREERLVRFVGLTTHVAFETVHAMISTGGFDQVLLAYGYFRKGMDTLLGNTKIEWRDRCLAKAHELRMAIVAMKVLGANVFSHGAAGLVPDYDAEALKVLPGAAMRWVLQDPRVALLNVGVSMPADVDANVKTLTENFELTTRDRAVLADFASRAYEAKSIQALRTS